MPLGPEENEFLLDVRDPSVRDKVTKGTSALFLLTGEATEGKVVEAIKPYDFEVISTNLSNEEEEKLRAAFENEEKDDNSPSAL